MTTDSKSSSGPWSYLLGGAGLALVAGVLAEMGYGLAAYPAAVIAGVCLLIGSIAQGLRVGQSAHCDDHRGAVSEHRHSPR
ncbi:hypothetical protein [Nocardioides sp.]|uniref:hypothetical protein n=1 Tax=Nocardioides sp. TaxID=35761 RepID=UPI002C677E10|nr:hypothetical protein [Nocardioides sp.]HXH76923.1 hypothetical protein [Nocardioides sp.]